MTTSGGKHLEDFNYAHIFSPNHKIKCSAKVCDDFSFGFDGDRTKRREELTADKNHNGENHVRKMVGVVFSLAENQEEATYGLSSNITLTRKSNSGVLNRAEVIAIAKLIVNSI